MKEKNEREQEERDEGDERDERELTQWDCPGRYHFLAKYGIISLAEALLRIGSLPMERVLSHERKEKKIC